jgi:hypothetical protein
VSIPWTLYPIQESHQAREITLSTVDKTKEEEFVEKMSETTLMNIMARIVVNRHETPTQMSQICLKRVLIGDVGSNTILMKSYVHQRIRFRQLIDDVTPHSCARRIIEHAVNNEMNDYIFPSSWRPIYISMLRDAFEIRMPIDPLPECKDMKIVFVGLRPIFSYPCKVLISNFEDFTLMKLREHDMIVISSADMNSMEVSTLYSNYVVESDDGNDADLQLFGFFLDHEDMYLNLNENEPRQQNMEVSSVYDVPRLRLGDIVGIDGTEDTDFSDDEIQYLSDLELDDGQQLHLEYNWSAESF